MKISRKVVSERGYEPENLLDMLRRKGNMAKEEINTIVNVTYGGFVYIGDYRCIAPTMEAIEEKVMPLMEKGNEKAAKMGLIPIQRPDSQEGFG